MPRDAQGVYTPPSNSWNPPVEGTEIDAPDWQAVLDDQAAALNDYIPPLGTNLLVGRGSDGVVRIYTAGDGVTIDGAAGTISVTNALTSDEPEMPVIGTGGTYTVTAADRDISPDGRKLQLRINVVRNTTLSNGVVVTFPASSAITIPGSRFIFLVASDQTGAVTFVPAAGGTINGGTAAIQARGVNSLVSVLVRSNPGTAPVMILEGDTTEDKVIGGNVTFEGDVVYEGTASALDSDVAKTASYTADITHDQRVVTASHATVAIDATIPPVVDVPWREGALLTIIQTGAAAAAFVAGAGVTISKESGKTLVARARYTAIMARHSATPDTWIALGDLGT